MSVEEINASGTATHFDVDQLAAFNEQQESDGLERLTLPEVLRAVQNATPIPIPIPNPALLPLYQLDPEVLERLAAEVVSRRDNINTHFYGRRGQKQYGLDIVEFEREWKTSLYQVKRYETLSAVQMRDIVDEYAGAPRAADYSGPERRFNPHRFVIVTSAPVESDTGNIDGIQNLQEAYQGDLAIEVWGAEALGRKLRDAPHTVLAIFGEAWAKAWCGFEPVAPPPNAPRPLGLVEGPLSVLNLDAMEADAVGCQESNPLAAAAIYGSIAEGLKEGNFPGHAAAMRRRQADAFEAGGNWDEAFKILFELGLDKVLAWENFVFADLRRHLDAKSAVMSAGQQDKYTVLGAIADWYERGTRLTVTVPALTRLAESGDMHVAVLTCLVIEQAIVDGLYDHSPAYSVVTSIDSDTAEHIEKLVNLAAALDVREVVLRARLHCAVADAALTLASIEQDVDRVYREIVENALAGRYRHARGLIASRAAYAYAVRGHADRANTLWRQSILASSEDGFYGDVRNAMRASRMIESDNGVLSIPGLEIAVNALPNRKRILSGTHDPALTTLDAAHRNSLPDAFGDARRYVWEGRLSGHLYEELIALSLFGDVLAAAAQDAVAVLCYVMAGDSKKAASLTGKLSGPIDVSIWTSSYLRRRQAAAIQVISKQGAFVRDNDVSRTIDTLLLPAGKVWAAPFLAPYPELDAIRAIASFAVRITESSIDSILAISAPALNGNTNISRDIAYLLIQAYWAVKSRREDLAGTIVAMLRLSPSPHGLWDFLRGIPATAREPLLHAVTELADTGSAEAIHTLSCWRQPSAAVHLAARRACAALLRWPVGIIRTQTFVGTQESVTVDLLLGLLQMDDTETVPVAELSPDKTQSPGGVLFSTSHVESNSEQKGDIVNGDTTDDPLIVAPQKTPLGPPRDGDEPDEAAVKAAGPLPELAVAVARQLTAIAGDTYQGAGSRVNALSALRSLLPLLGRPITTELVPELIQISREPRLSEVDNFELSTDMDLSRARIRTGARDLAGFALVAAAEAFSQGRESTVLADDEEHAIANEIVAHASRLLRDGSDSSSDSLLGALSVVAVARSTPELAFYATSLLVHGNEQVRALGARYATGSPDMFRVMADDPSPLVRGSTACRAPELPDDVREQLARDPNAIVRWDIMENTR